MADGARARPPVDRPAFYAVGRGRGRGGIGDWITLLHPPYTAWHLCYVAIGGALAPRPVGWRIGVAVAAFFLAVGVGAHALDELHGRPLRTGIPTAALTTAAVVSVAGAVALGVWFGGWRLAPFIAVGGVLVVGYNLELFGGALHNAAGFAAAWGAFPVLTGYWSQHWTLGVPAALAAAAAFALSWAQRTLSMPVRTVRRHALSASAQVTLDDGRELVLDRAALVAPLEQALHLMAWGLVLVTGAVLVARL